MPTLTLIDGSGFIFRAFHAIPHLSTTKGVPTNAVLGFTTMLLKALREHAPTHAALVFDASRFRETAPVRGIQPRRVCLVDHKPRVVFLLQFHNLGQWREVAVHREDGFGDDHRPRSLTLGRIV